MLEIRFLSGFSAAFLKLSATEFEHVVEVACVVSLSMVEGGLSVELAIIDDKFELVTHLNVDLCVVDQRIEFCWLTFDLLLPSSNCAPTELTKHLN